MHIINIASNYDPGLCARRVWGYLARQVNIYEWEGKDGFDSFLCDLNIFERYIRKGMEQGKKIELRWDCNSETGYTDLQDYEPNSSCDVRFKIEIDWPYREIRIERI